ncbi:hypothetical protein Clacol_008996 [Clathrus columnatus]|uniref:Polysaccharide biosynthesis domain-containing protein n=1 Tax=Clathrus columnatus TaxID=1419009 RepID=A0AAV5AJB7_9AGAM|nr:hypothetical protein Clacol_008996 [Clathrus columnatus]
MSKFDPQNAQNLVEIEKQFAVVAVEQAQLIISVKTYWNLLASVKPRELRLTKIDDEIFEDVSAAFPDMVKEPYTGLIKVDENMMKNEDGKVKWRDFISKCVLNILISQIPYMTTIIPRYEEKVKDYNFGSLIRVNANDEYSQDNTIFVTRMQFYAIEIARNRLGLNDEIHVKAKQEIEAEKAEKAKEKEKAEKKRKKGSS